MAVMAAEANFSEYGRALADAIDAVIEDWVVRCVDGRMRDFTGAAAPPEVLDAARGAGRQAREEVLSELRALLALDVDEQRTNPLALLRAAVRFPTEVLRAAGVPAIVRDEFDERAFPDDIYGLAPASFNEVARELTVKAAGEAGFSVRLLEEPQAAFYAAMERGALEALGDEGFALVVDVGGGTTDLSLMKVSRAGNERRVERVAVGQHLLLGGDNMDLALAHAVEPRLAGEGAKLEPRLFAELVVASRDAKERLLGDESPDAIPIAIAKRGTVVGTVGVHRDSFV
jgi:hypothetical protein